MAQRKKTAIGAIGTDKDGYTRLKIAHIGPGETSGGYGNSRVWCYMHRYVWEQANGEIPTGCVIRFRDGDKTNVTLENLELVSRSQQLSDQRQMRADVHAANKRVYANALMAAACHLDSYRGEHAKAIAKIANRLRSQANHTDVQIGNR
jgi:hypothetical protein